MARSGPVNAQINLKVKFYLNGVLVDPYNIEDVNIYTASVGGSAIATLSPTKESTGLYTIAFNAEDYGLSLVPQTLYDEWTWIGEVGMSTKTQRYSFDLTEAEEDAEETTTTAVAAVCRTPPSWTNRLGLMKVDDLGNGSGIFLGWEEARPANYLHAVHYNVYYSDARLTVFEEGPKATTAEKYSTIYLNDPGNVYYFAVRACEFSAEFDISEMSQVGVHLYSYPDATALTDDLAFASVDGYDVLVEDVTGFPDVGELLIGREILYYAGIDRANNRFIVPDDGRGYETTSIDQHREGAVVSFWTGVEDGNTVIRQGIATWFKQTPRNVDAVGELNVGVDGYRTISEDLVTTDLSSNDENNQDSFPSFDFTGYHRPSPQSTFSGDCVGSYAGGEFNGARGLFLNERNLARLDMLLQISGEPIILLRRIWHGEKCSCYGLRREHQRTRCEKCYGTGFNGGYDRFINTRPISETSRNTEGCILIRVHPFVDDLKIEQSQGLIQPSELTAWTISVPQIKDRDIIVRFDGDGVEEFRYECLDVTRSKILMNSVGRQEFRMRRLDKTDIVMAFNTDI